MDIAECYRLLELTPTATINDLKATYRRLARQCHPDLKPGDQQAHQRFIQLTEAYQALLKVLPVDAPVPSVHPKLATQSPQASSPSTQVQVSVRKPSPGVAPDRGSATQVASGSSSSHPPYGHSRPQTPTGASSARGSSLSAVDQKLKYNTHRQLQGLLQAKRFPRAIAMVEELRAQLPHDPEVRQWQALIYQSWGRQLIRERKVEQARTYLKKALHTDPHNRTLWAEVERDFARLEQIF